MAQHKEVKVDPEDIRHAQKTWDNFVTGSKYATGITAVILILLAISFVKFI